MEFLTTTIKILSEFVVLLSNERKRALHDFIAGTVVVQQTMLTCAKSPNDDALEAAS